MSETKSDGKKTKKKGDDSDDAPPESEITDFKENHTDTTVSFTITATKDKIDEFEKAKGGLLGKFKLSSTLSTKNMMAFDKDGNIKQYDTNVDIMKEFHRQRMVFYHARKDLLVNRMQKELSMLENKHRFVMEVVKGDLIVSNRKRAELLAELKEREYDLFPKDTKKAAAHKEESEDEDDEVVEDNTSDAELAKGYEYLLGMKIWSLTFERAEELRKQTAEKDDEVKKLEATSPQQIWLADLDAIEELLDERDKELGLEAKKQKSQPKKKAFVAKKNQKDEVSDVDTERADH